jgi:hypothetical protein
MSAPTFDDRARHEFDLVQADVVAALKTLAAAGNSKEVYKAHATLGALLEGRIQSNGIVYETSSH